MMFFLSSGRLLLLARQGRIDNRQRAFAFDVIHIGDPQHTAELLRRHLQGTR